MCRRLFSYWLVCALFLACSSARALERDKALHLTTSALAVTGASLGLQKMGLTKMEAVLMSTLAVMVAGHLKETLDAQRGGYYDGRDMFFNGVGSVFGAVIVIGLD